MQKRSTQSTASKVTEFNHQHNPFVKDFKMILEMPEEDLAHGKIVISAKQRPAGEHARRYNQQTNLEEVSILTKEAPHDLVLHRRGGGLTSIHDLNPKGMPLHCAFSSWNIWMESRRKTGLREEESHHQAVLCFSPSAA